MDPILIKKIQLNLTKDLPGQSAQAKMAHPERMKFGAIPDDHKPSAVLLLLFKEKKDWKLIFVERITRKGDVHSGQIGFPGGKLESSDLDLQACALRETYEEIGISPDKIKIIGQMSSLFIPVSNFNVYPFIGYLQEAPEFKIQEAEINQVFTFYLKKLSNPNIVKLTEIQISEKITLHDIPYFDIDNKIVWGATAMMISEFLCLLK
jgi:8-oxo-dGTP pyrophosphatase MutT (NUDIX family)